MLNKALIEKHYPIAGSIVATSLAIFFKFDLKSFSDLITNSLTITSIFIGFIGTLAGIILASDSKAIAFMKRIGKLSILYSYIWLSLQLSFLFVFLCIFIEIFPSYIFIYPWLSWAWVWFGSYSLLLIHRSISVSIVLLKSATFNNVNNN